MTIRNQGLPDSGYSLVDKDGKINPVWYQFMMSLWTRTGGSDNTGNVQSIEIAPGSGITSSVVDDAGDVTINLTLGAITPSSVASSGPVTGTVGSFQNGLSTFGPMQFGSPVLGAIGATGYILIVDINGNPQKLMIGT